MKLINFFKKICTFLLAKWNAPCPSDEEVLKQLDELDNESRECAQPSKEECSQPSKEECSYRSEPSKTKVMSDGNATYAVKVEPCEGEVSKKRRGRPRKKQNKSKE